MRHSSHGGGLARAYVFAHEGGRLDNPSLRPSIRRGLGIRTRTSQPTFGIIVLTSREPGLLHNAELQ